MTSPATDRATALAVAAGLSPDEGLMLQMTPTALLVAAVQGPIDLPAMAHEALANRGLDGAGHWVGFTAASKALLSP